MANKGLVYSPLGIIQNLRNNLKSGYEPESIPRELLQNADDAGASCFHFGWTPGLPRNEVSNPLLADPALFVVNDGPFTEENAQAIRLVGVSSKGGDGGTIGKFGLGLKSVFCVCEVFYFVAGDHRDEPRVFDVINPWSDTKLPGVEAFDRFETSDAKCIMSHLDSILRNLERFFVVWFPLRSRGQFSKHEPIHPEWFNDRTRPPPTIFDGLGQRIAAYLPLLHCVQEVTTWEHPNHRHPSSRATFQSIGKRRRRPTEMVNSESLVKGDIKQWAGEALKCEAPYVVLTKDLTEQTSRLRGSDYWPSTVVVRGEKEETEKEANPAHVGVCWQRRPTQPGRIRFSWRWAAFLPLRREQPLPFEMDNGDFEFSLTLHASGFVNPGRTEFLSGDFSDPPSSPEELYRSWNHALIENGTLPLLPESILEFSRHASLSERTVGSLVGGLASNEFLQHPIALESICSLFQLVYRWSPDGAAWTTVPSSATLAEIPDPHGMNPETAIPFLQELSTQKHVCLVLEGWQRLACEKAAWKEDLLCRALDSAAEDDAVLPYVARFVQAVVPGTPSQMVEESLVGLIRRLLKTGVNDDRRKHLREAAGRLRADRRLCLPFSQPAIGPCPILGRLLEAHDARRLALLPQSLDLDGQAVLTVAEATALLETLHDISVPGQVELRTKIAIAVLKKSRTDHLSEILDRCNRLQLFLGHCVEQGATQQRFLTVVEVREADRKGTLFVDDGPSLARHLSSAIRETILLVPQDVGSILVAAVGPCNADTCASLLSRWEFPSLSDPEARASLLSAMSAHAPSRVASGADYRRAVRLLLHGRLDRLKSESPLLYDLHGAGLWGRLSRAALGPEDQWRLIDPALASRVPPSLAEEYGLVEVGPQAAGEELRRLGADQLNKIPLQLTAEEAVEVLLHVEGEDILRALPIHEDAACGGLERIGPKSYWDDGITLPQELPHPPVLLRRSSNVKARAVQNTLTHQVGHADAILILLAQPDPHRYWRPILDSFYSLGRAVPRKVLDELKSKPWLPGPEAPVEPGSVLHLPEMADVLATLPLQLFQGLVPSSRLLEVGEHPGLQSLVECRLVPPVEDALGLLGTALADDGRYHVGHSSEFLTDDAQGQADLISFLQAFEGAPEEVMAVHPLAAAADHLVGRGLCVRALLAPLKLRLTEDRLLRVLDFLARRHEQGGPRDHVERAFLWYLAMAEGLASGRFPDGLRLLSDAGTWRPPSELCVGTDAINPERRLDERQLKLIRPWVEKRQPPAPALFSPNAPTLPQGAALDDALDLSAKRLGDYFGKWERARPHLRPVIGGFLATLGDGQGGAVRRLAEQFLLPACELEDLRERMRRCRTSETGPTRFDTRRVLMEDIDAAMVEVTNLCGGQIEVPLVQTVESLLIPFGDGNFMTEQQIEQGRPVQVSRLRLRRIDPEALADRLPEMLYDAAYQVLEHFYWLFLERDVFAPLIHADSQQLRAAQNLILDNAPLYLGQLGVSDRGALGRAIRQMHLARNLAAQEEVAVEHLEPGSQAPPRLAPERRRQARAALQAQLRQPATQSAVLEAIRRKVGGDFAYVAESVPFEILQNADDAAVESLDEGRDWFGIWAGQGRVAFLHEGRAINQPPVGRPHDPLLGHERDLEKMLVLASSDKPASKQGLTGRFGLGFKSVFMVCDEPLARSGALGFRVLGGIYPEGLAAGEAMALDERFAQVAGRPLGERTGTILELPLRESRDAAFLDRFVDLLPAALAFTQRIRRCAVRVGGENEVHWGQPAPVAEVAGVSVGLLEGSRLFRQQRVLVLNLGERRMLLIGLNPDGPCRLHDDVPTVWVTAPTRIECRVGFALNAPFDLDVGRTQLQREEAHHQPLADALGAELGRCLVALHDAPWEDVRQALGLRAELTRQQFWKSVWARFGKEFHDRRRESDDLALRLLQRALYGKEGLRRLYSECHALPTDLPGDRFGGLTLLGNVKYCLSGCLDEDPRLLSRVERWPALVRRAGSGELVSRSRVWEPLIALLPAGSVRCDPVNLASVMEWELENARPVDPNRAAEFGVLITKDFVDSLEGQERKSLRDALKLARFVHAGQGDASPWELLVCEGQGIEDEEKRRAAFAPTTRRLAAGYKGAALNFFLACRDRRAAITVDEIAGWFRTAEGEARRAALQYLEHGELAWQITQRLREATTPNDWWRDPLVEGDLGDTARVLVGLASGGIVTSSQQPPPGPTSGPTPTVDSIHRWWQENRGTLRERHLQWTYPPFLRRSVGPSWLSRDQADMRTAAGRRRWVAMLLLGMTQGFGRAGRHGEQRRGFLEECESRGWIARFAAPTDDEQWIAFIDDFVRDRLGHIPYFHAFRSSFVGARVLVRWLEEHLEVFRQMGNRTGPFSLLQAFRPGSDPHLSGSGISPPPLAQVLSSVGASFLLREMVRGGLLPNTTFIVPHCYPPTTAVRRLLAEMGCPGMANRDDRWVQSRLIHRFLSDNLADPTFGGDYDIPLWMFACERPQHTSTEDDEP